MVIQQRHNYMMTFTAKVMLTRCWHNQPHYSNSIIRKEDNLLADKVSNIGDISLPGMLDIGTSTYTDSRTRCNAEVGGYTGYAELKAASSYDMFVNLSTTRTDGGWMYFKINNDDHVQLSSSDNKLNIHKDTTSGNFDVDGIMRTTGIKLTTDVWDNFPLVITSNGDNWFQGGYKANADNAGCLFRYKTSGSSSYWWSGVLGSNTNDFNI